MDHLATRISEDIINAINSDQLILPTLPEVALRVRAVADDPTADIEHLVGVVGSDPALSARLIRVANSPLLRAARLVDNLNGALMRLGIEYACNMATSLAMEQMFQSTSDIIDMRMREAWFRSSQVAAISYVLCKHYTNLNPDKAMLAGILHQIGVLPILSFAEDHPELLNDSITLDRIIENIHAPIGRLILSHWGFDEDILSIPEDHLKFYEVREKVAYADLITISVLQYDFFRDSRVSSLDFSKISAFDRLGLDCNIDIGASQSLALDVEAAEDVLRSDGI
ncbi:HDOD domain-containing protein [Cellvibrio sp. UBA7661]|uniref:HDOD domain-containing protein n=1 Tax=Cellvibrio sp. UBA7661 TaxID=1946311 RepID=UPI002F35ECF6